MITIKDYANKTGKSVQAVYKQMKSSKNKARLNGHIIKENGITYLDDDAIAILNESRSSHIVIVDQNKDAEIERLKEENRQLLAKMNIMQEEWNKKQSELYERLEDKSKRIEQLHDEMKLISTSLTNDKKWYQFWK